MENNFLLECRKVSKTFGPTKAVDHVDFYLNHGEIRGLCGENGSGKSTLASIISAVWDNESGEMLLEGQPYNPSNQLDSNNLGVFMIKQEMGTIDGLTVAENIFFGHEKDFMKYGLRNLKKMNNAAREVLNGVGLDHIEPSFPIEMYNFEQRKAIELAKACSFNPKILIVDETTTALSHEMRDFLYDIIKKLRDKGSSVIFISHDLQEVLTICNNVTVLKDGQLVDTFACKDINENKLKTAMVGRELTGDYYRNDFEPSYSDEVVLEAKNVSIPGKISDVSIELHKGEILGFGGLSEAGLHEFGKALFGFDLNQKGEILLKKSGKRITSIKSAMKNGVGYVPKNRDQEGLYLDASIKDNIAIANLDNIGNSLFVDPFKAKKFANKNAEDIQVKMTGVDQLVNALSGGNKQKVSLAKWLARQSDIMILDSPTRGIDVKVKAQIYQEMIRLKENGTSIIMISEELLELIGMCDRILIFADGKINGEFMRSKDLSEEDLVHKMI